MTSQARIPKHLQNDANEIQQMFDQMMGTSNADVEVIAPKMAKICNYLVRCVKVISILSSFDGFWSYFPHHQHWKKELLDFLDSAKMSLDLDTNHTYSENDFIPDEYNKLLDPKTDLEMYKRIQAQVNEKYNQIKNADCVKHLVDSADNLAQYKAALIQIYIPKEERERRENAQKNKEESKDQNDITLPEQTGTMKSDEFIFKEPGTTLKPLTFTTLDLKYIWAEENIDQTGRKMVLKILAHIYWIGIDIYDLVTSPDVDIHRFSAMLIESISTFRKRIPRCQNAFRIIENSVQLLEKNFKRYYRDSKEANNSNLLMEMFILDVAQTQKADPKVLIEFRTIINYLRKSVNGSNDPRVKSLIKMLDNNFNLISQEMKKENIDLDSMEDLTEEPVE